MATHTDLLLRVSRVQARGGGPAPRRLELAPRDPEPAPRDPEPAPRDPEPAPRDPERALPHSRRGARCGPVL
ncbi:hypothetical protein [Kribbella kalugense]|uniref:hypothetical protein n=1 Tax=Kribbella kalugense TaxID=2512221 RepID=UPI001416F997|nr:hypothetical protein [Kribbella kalugense]